MEKHEFRMTCLVSHVVFRKCLNVLTPRSSKDGMFFQTLVQDLKDVVGEKYQLVVLGRELPVEAFLDFLNNSPGA